MSKTATTPDSLVSPSPAEASGLSELRSALSKLLNAKSPASLVGADGQPVPLPDSAFRALAVAVEAMSRGQAITLIPQGRSLTTQEAAEILHVSRPHLIKLLESGEIAFDKVGTHRRIAIEDVLAYRERRDAERRQALREMTQLGQELGGYR